MTKAKAKAPFTYRCKNCGSDEIYQQQFSNLNDPRDFEFIPNPAYYCRLCDESAEYNGNTDGACRVYDNTHKCADGCNPADDCAAVAYRRLLRCTCHFVDEGGEHSDACATREAK